MRRWAKDVLRRWKERRIRTKRVHADYRAYDRNLVILESGGTL